MLLEVGRIHKAHGLEGEVIVGLVTNRTERLDPGTVSFWSCMSFESGER